MKYLKLLLLGAALIGGVVLIMHIITPPSNTFEFNTTSTKAWQVKIDSLCSESNWTSTGYDSIYFGIDMERKISSESTISKSEEKTLHKYLFISSSKYWYKIIDSFFKRNTYPESEIKKFSKALNFLGKYKDNFQIEEFDKAKALLNNYYNVWGILNYDDVKECLKKYPKTIVSFPPATAEERRNKIEQNPYYKSHFINNGQIKQLSANMVQCREQKEKEYYKDLELAIESAYRKTNDYDKLLEDRALFIGVCPDSEYYLIERLISFIAEVGLERED